MHVLYNTIDRYNSYSIQQHPHCGMHTDSYIEFAIHIPLVFCYLVVEKIRSVLIRGPLQYSRGQSITGSPLPEGLEVIFELCGTVAYDVS